MIIGHRQFFNFYAPTDTRNESGFVRAVPGRIVLGNNVTGQDVTELISKAIIDHDVKPLIDIVLAHPQVFTGQHLHDLIAAERAAVPVDPILKPLLGLRGDLYLELGKSGDPTTVAAVKDHLASRVRDEKIGFRLMAAKVLTELLSLDRCLGTDEIIEKIRVILALLDRVMQSEQCRYIVELHNESVGGFPWELPLPALRLPPHHQINELIANRQPISLEDPPLNHKERRQYLDDFKWCCSRYGFFTRYTHIVAHQAAISGDPMPRVVLMNSGGRSDNFSRTFFAHTPLQTDFPFEIITCDSYRNDTKKGFHFGVIRNRSAIQIFISFPKFLRFVRENPNLLGKHPSYVQINGSYVEAFRDFILREKYPIMIFMPTRDCNLLTFALSHAGLIHGVVLSPTASLPLSSPQQEAYQAIWADEAHQALLKLIGRPGRQGP